MNETQVTMSLSIPIRKMISMMVYEGLLRKTRCPTCDKPILQNFKEPILNCYECNHKAVIARRKLRRIIKH